MVILTHTVRALCQGPLSDLLIDSLKTLPARRRGYCHYHPFYRKETHSVQKVLVTVKRAAGLCQILHLHPRLLAEAAPPPSRPPPLHSPQSSPMSRTGAAADSWPLRCSAWVRARLLLGGIRSTAEPTVFPDSFSHAALSLFLQENVGQIFREHHCKRRPSS